MEGADYIEVYITRLEAELASESLTGDERKALLEALDEARRPQDPTPSARTSPRPLSRAEFEAEWAFLLRWPLETRLGCLRILRELGVLEAMEKKRPEELAFLMEMLTTGPPRQPFPPPDALMPQVTLPG